MWSFFWVLLIGGYWIIRLLNESSNKFAYQMRDAENNIKYDGLYVDIDDEWELKHKIKDLLNSHPFYFSKNYCGEKVEEFEMIMDDLHDIFGNYVEYIYGMGCELEKFIAGLIHSKSSKILRYYNFSLGVPRYSGFYAEQIGRCGEITDTVSYKSFVGLRYYKKIEENIRKKYPDFSFVYHNIGKKNDIVENQLSIYHEESFSNQAISRRLWDDEPLSPDTAPTPIAPPKDYWKTK